MAEGVIPPPPWEAEAKKKGIPPPPWEQPPSTFSRIEQLKATAPKGEVAKKAATHLRSMGVSKAAADYEQEIADAKARAAGQAAEMLPFAAAAPFTAGSSLAVGAGLMGAAGLAGGLMRETVKAKMGSSEIPQTVGDVAKTLGVDAATGMVAEVGGRGLTKMVGEFAPKLIARSANKHEIGKALLTEDFANTRQALDQVTGKLHVDVTGSYQKFFDEISTLPKGSGKLGSRLTKLTEKTQAIVRDVGKDLAITGGMPAAQQPLDALVEMKGRLNQIAWDKTLKQESGREAVILRRFAGNLDKDIRAGLAAAGPEAESLYNKANSILKIQLKQSVGISMAEDAIRRMTYRTLGGAAIGATTGGFYGYRHGGAAGALKRGAEGAVLGATAGAIEAGIPRMSAWVYEMTMKHPVAKEEMRKAIQFYIAGQEGKASALASRAVMTADIRDAIKEAIRHPEVIAPTQPPEQMTPPATAQR